MNRAELFQRLWWQYGVENNHEPQELRIVVEWAIKRGWLRPKPVDPVDALTREMRQALRQEMGTSRNGRRFRRNHAVRVTENGEQKTKWVTLDFGEPSLVVMALGQRRNQVVGDLLQLKTDTDEYNALHPELQYVLDLDFTMCVAEEEIVSG